MHVSLIAGPSNVGKSTAAMAVAERVGGAIVEVDELARRSSDPALGFEHDRSVWQQRPEALCDLLINKGVALWPDVANLIARSARNPKPLIIEGEGPSPTDASTAHQKFGARSVFVIEPNASRLRATLSERSPSFRELPASDQGNVVLMNVLYGEWLRQECERLEIPWIYSQPWGTLPARCSEVLKL